MMGQILSAAGKAGIRPDSGEIRLLRVLAGHRHFSAHAKPIFHQLTRMWTTQGVGSSESMDARAYMGSNRTQKPICLLAGPLVSDRVAVQHKNVHALAAEGAASSLPALQAGRLGAFEVRIEPAEE
jgi:hypothetical protein